MIQTDCSVIHQRFFQFEKRASAEMGMRMQREGLDTLIIISGKEMRVGDAVADEDIFERLMFRIPKMYNCD